MREAFDRARSEPAPHLWPEIERRLALRPPEPSSRRGRHILSLTIAVALMTSVLVWALSSLRLGPGPAPTPLAPGEVVRIPVGAAPQPIAADDEAAWVVTGTTESGNFLWRIDARTNEATEVPGTRGAGWPAVGEGYAWVTCTGSRNPCHGNSVVELDRRTGATVATIPLPGHPWTIATGLGSAWVSTTAGLVKIDPVSARIVATFPHETDLLGTAAGSVWATLSGEGFTGVARIDPVDGRLIKGYGFHDPCRLLATDIGVWVSSCLGGLGGLPQDTLERIDPATGVVSYQVPLEQWGGAMSTPQGALWMTRWVGDHVEVDARDVTTGLPTGTVFTVRPGPRPWSSMGIGPAEVFTAVGADSIWLTHVDAADVVRLGVGPTSEGSPPAPSTVRVSPSAAQAPAGTFAFVALDQNSSANLYVAARGSGDATRIVANASPAGVSWSSDGSRVAFTRGSGEGHGAILSADEHGGDVRVVTTFGDPQYPSWSPTDGQIAFTTGSGDIYVAGADGSGLRKLTTSGDTCSDLHSTWSPDGSRIAFDRDCTTGGDPGIHVLDVASGQVTVFAERGTIQGLSWSPDGTSLAFGGTRRAPGIQTIHADGSGVHRLTTSVDAFPVWSEDGSSIAFVRDGQIWLVPSSGGAPTAAVTVPGLRIVVFAWKAD